MDVGTAKAVEAAAKTADTGLRLIQDTGKYFSELVGDLPKNAVGLLGGDWLAAKRLRNLDALRRRTEAIFRERDHQAADLLSPKLATELLEGAQDESQSELIELWARLLANALDPALNNVRRSFVVAVRDIDPADARVLEYLRTHGYVQVGIQTTDKEVALSNLVTVLATTHDDVVVSLDHLTTVGLIGKRDQGFWVLTPFGKEFLRACYPP